MATDDNVIPFPGDRRGLSHDELDALAQDLIEKTGGPLDAVAALMASFRAAAGADEQSERRRPELLARREERAGFVVRVDLDDAKPPIWRRLRLASDLTLAQLHDILQVAMGWTDSHLHHFVMGPRLKDWRAEPFLTSYDLSEGETGTPEAEVRLDEVVATKGDRLFYEYDFGDSWHHTIKVEKVEPWVEGAPEAACLDGRRACPPEDVGGMGGYEELLEALAGRELEDPDWAEQLRTWAPEGFDAAAFSVADTNELLVASLPDLDEWNPALESLLDRAGNSPLSATGEVIRRATTGPWELDAAQAEAATHRYRHLLKTVGAGITLTAAGYLPPRLVKALFHDLDLDDGWSKPTREDQTYPVLALRESATSLGLLRKSRGRLLPTKVGLALADDPHRLLTHIASRLPLGRGHERDAGLLALLLSAAGAPWPDAFTDAGSCMHELGWRAEGGDLDVATRRGAQPTMAVFDNLVGREDDPKALALVARALLRS